MERIKRSWLVALVFLVGCATGGAVSHVAVPPAEAKSVQKWEYHCMKLNTRVSPTSDGPVGQLNKAGEQGFELVAVLGDRRTACMKRPAN